MDITANPVLSLFSAAGAPTATVPAASGTATPFGFLLGAVNSQQSENPLLTEGGTTDVSSFLIKLNDLLVETTSVELPVSVETAIENLTQLADTLDQLNLATGGAFLPKLAEAMQGLAPLASAEQAEVADPSDLVMSLDELMAAVTEVAETAKGLVQNILTGQNASQSASQLALVGRSVDADVDLEVNAPDTIAGVPKGENLLNLGPISAIETAQNAAPVIATITAVKTTKIFSNAPQSEAKNGNVAPKSPSPIAVANLDIAPIQAIESLAAEAEPSVPNLAVDAKINPNVAKVFDAITATVNAPVQNLVNVEKTLGKTIELPRELVPLIVPESAPQLREAVQASVAPQAARANESQTPRFAAAIVNQVRAVDFHEGTTKVELTPRGLGTIEVEMKTNADGSLSVVVRAENAHVLSGLREERDALAQAISDAGQSSFEFQEFSQGDSQDDQSQSGYQATGFVDGFAEGETDTASNMTISGGQLDLMT